MATLADLLNHFAPDFSLPMLGGGRFNPADHRGKIVILNFWSAECPWSRRADVVLVYRQLTWARKGVVIAGIAANLNEPESEMRFEADVRHVQYPILLDHRQQVVELYKAETTPHFYVIDQQGMIRYIGALDDATFQKPEAKSIHLDRAVNALLEERAPDPALTAPYGCSIVKSGGSSGPAPARV